jgi:trimeric autotransporter adhesin
MVSRHAKYLTALALAAFVSSFEASEHKGQVRAGEVPIPGVVVLAKQGDKVFRAVTDSSGSYAFPDLADGSWTVRVEMAGFETEQLDVAASRDAEIVQWNLKMLPMSEMTETAAPGFSTSSVSAPTLQMVAPVTEAQDQLLINGSVSNGASTPFALAAGFGNNRRPGRSLYTGAVSFNGNNSVLDARSFSLTGQNSPRPGYNRLQSTITVGGPFQIPSLFRNGSFSVVYSRIQNRNASLQTLQMPTAAERSGDFSASSRAIVDPLTGTSFAGNVIPEDRISPQAKALIDLYPLPNFSSERYNYQLPIVGVTHGDNLSGQISNFTIDNANRLSAAFGIQSTRSDNPDVFGFTDTVNGPGANGSVTWIHRFSQRVTGNIRYQFARTVTQALPYFGTRLDVSGIAGILGNDRDPRNWGPPALNFSGGIARLSTGSYAFDRNQAHTIGYTSTYVVGRHALGYGADFRRQQFNLLSQREARGTFTFTGAATGIDFADFLLGIPTASSIAFGNADKYFRQNFYSAYVTDDYRVKASLTLTIGARFEYEAPITERYGRLVNLDIAPDFASATPRVAGSSSESLVYPDKSGVEPRMGLAWRPRAGASLVVRASYGVYRDTAVYRAIADQMAQQSPLSKSLSVQNTPEQPLTLADGFRGSPSVTATTFAIDPGFRVGTAQNWQLSLQQDLPQAMQMTITYLGIKGTHVPQRMLPNTYPDGAVKSCAACPLGFTYLTSGGNSNRHSGTIEVRRRQRNGFQASVLYTYSKAIDDAGISGNLIAQNWLDRKAERALSNFDQRHAAQVQVQYTSGMLARLGSFWDGWRGTLLKEWTVLANMTVGSGLPLTPAIIAPVPGTAITSSLRPDVTGVPVYDTSAGGFLNPAAYVAPQPGRWGNAGRNTITGPGQFGLNAALARTFRVNERVSMDLRVDATNVLNHVTFPNWNTTVNSSQFGLPTRANAMRTILPSLRVRF